MGTGREGTILLEEYSVQKNISIVDTRGFFEGDEQLMEECLNIISGRYAATYCELIDCMSSYDQIKTLDFLTRRQHLVIEN